MTFWECDRPTLNHVSGDCTPLMSYQRYIGFGDEAQQLKPSSYSNAFRWLLPPQDALERYAQLLKARPDRVHFLSCLFNQELICDCNDPHYCHSELLVGQSTILCQELLQEVEDARIPSHVDPDDAHLANTNDKIPFVEPNTPHPPCMASCMASIH